MQVVKIAQEKRLQVMQGAPRMLLSWVIPQTGVAFLVKQLSLGYHLI